MIKQMSDLPVMPIQPNSSTPLSNKGEPSNVPPATQPIVGTSSIAKEQEPTLPVEDAKYSETYQEMELTPELESAGLERRSETIELPPDIQKMGVSAVGPAQPITPATAVTLPLSDDQIIVGLHAQIISSLRWLAEWCIRRLKQSHIHLRQKGSHVIRETA